MEELLSSFSGEYYYSLAALFSGAAYLMSNILWLRILLVCAAMTYIVTGISMGLTSMVGWNSAYLLINFYHIVILLIDKVTIALPPDIRNIYGGYFTTLSTREFKKLMQTNPLCFFQEETIIEEAERPDRLYILLRGEVNIVKRGRTIATLGPGNFIGEMSFLSRGTASANAIAENMVQCAYWTHDDLERLKRRNIVVYDKFIAVLGCDLVNKLEARTAAEIENVTQLDFIV